MKKIQNKALLPMGLTFLVLVNIVSSCVKDKIDFLEHNQIYGTLMYDDIQRGTKLLPAGQNVKVFLNDQETGIYSFKTIDSGKYTFSPFTKGRYYLTFSYIDSVLQYNAALVEKVDLDTLRKSSSNAVLYFGRTSPDIQIDSSNRSYARNVTLESTDTRLKLEVVDEQMHLLPNVRVCLYSNKVFAQQNAPYCAGCIAYLSTDINGIVVFTGLQPQAYYINARADIGTVHITNQWSDDMRSTDELTTGQLSTKKVVLK